MFDFLKKKTEYVEVSKPLTKEEALAFLMTQDVSLDELCDLSIKALGNVFDTTPLSKDEEYVMFKEMGKIEGLSEYMADTMSRDIKRAFGSDPRVQEQVRGAYSRTLYFRSLMNRKSPDSEPVKPEQLSSDRYAGGSD